MSPEMLHALAELPSTDPVFYSELSQPWTIAANPKKGRQNKKGTQSQPLSSDLPPLAMVPKSDIIEGPWMELGDDDENIPTSVIIKHVLSNGAIISDKYIEQDGRLVTNLCSAEQLENLHLEGVSGSTGSSSDASQDTETEIDAVNSDTADQAGSDSDYSPHDTHASASQTLGSLANQHLTVTEG